MWGHQKELELVQRNGLSNNNWEYSQINDWKQILKSRKHIKHRWKNTKIHILIYYHQIVEIKGKLKSWEKFIWVLWWNRSFRMNTHFIGDLLAWKIWFGLCVLTMAMCKFGWLSNWQLLSPGSGHLSNSNLLQKAWRTLGKLIDIPQTYVLVDSHWNTMIRITSHFSANL